MWFTSFGVIAVLDVVAVIGEMRSIRSLGAFWQHQVLTSEDLLDLALQTGSGRVGKDSGQSEKPPDTKKPRKSVTYEAYQMMAER
jgi:hypothetical protein